ncbi:serine hydrolase [Streptomyces sp. NPDC057539]|uniref:serine hydrolase n=1 Tax=Streptomyces sp. NPDC057539 TaxID=3346159 RepID=UPI0036912BAD
MPAEDEKEPLRARRARPRGTTGCTHAHRSRRRRTALALTVRPPGETEEYSNFGYAILGAVLVAAAETRYEDLVTHHFLAPLGLEPGAMTARPPQHRSLRRGPLGRTTRPDPYSPRQELPRPPRIRTSYWGLQFQEVRSNRGEYPES